MLRLLIEKMILSELLVRRCFFKIHGLTCQHSCGEDYSIRLTFWFVKSLGDKMAFVPNVRLLASQMWICKRNRITMLSNCYYILNFLYKYADVCMIFYDVAPWSWHFSIQSWTLWKAILTLLREREQVHKDKQILRQFI